MDISLGYVLFATYTLKIIGYILHTWDKHAYNSTAELRWPKHLRDHEKLFDMEVFEQLRVIGLGPDAVVFGQAYLSLTVGFLLLQYSVVCTVGSLSLSCLFFTS